MTSCYNISYINFYFKIYQNCKNLLSCLEALYMDDSDDQNWNYLPGGVEDTLCLKSWWYWHLGSNRGVMGAECLGSSWHCHLGSGRGMMDDGCWGAVEGWWMMGIGEQQGGWLGVFTPGCSRIGVWGPRLIERHQIVCVLINLSFFQLLWLLLNMYPKLRTVSRALTLAVKLAKECLGRMSWGNARCMGQGSYHSFLYKNFFNLILRVLEPPPTVWVCVEGLHCICKSIQQAT